MSLIFTYKKGNMQFYNILIKPIQGGYSISAATNKGRICVITNTEPTEQDAIQILTKQYDNRKNG